MLIQATLVKLSRTHRHTHAQRHTQGHTHRHTHIEVRRRLIRAKLGV